VATLCSSCDRSITQRCTLGAMVVCLLVRSLQVCDAVQDVFVHCVRRCQYMWYGIVVCPPTPVEQHKVTALRGNISCYQHGKHFHFHLSDGTAVRQHYQGTTEPREGNSSLPGECIIRLRISSGTVSLSRITSFSFRDRGTAEPVYQL
jgi:hypothetical protein